MDSNTLLEWLKAHKDMANFDFSQMSYNDSDNAEYDEDSDKCKSGYVVGYLDALSMLIRNVESSMVFEKVKNNVKVDKED